jgi:transcriptional regulator with XRE-family HTH domain
MSKKSKIRKRREELLMTQEELANAIGYTTKSASMSISRWESGKRKPSFKSLRKLAEALQCNPSDLIEEDE